MQKMDCLRNAFKRISIRLIVDLLIQLYLARMEIGIRETHNYYSMELG